MTLFKKRYRIESPRLPGKDYTDNGIYFVTICTRGGEHVFGEIQNGVMCLSETGTAIAEEWRRTEQLRYYVTLDRWVIMPNHMHAIIVMQRNPTIDFMLSANHRTYVRMINDPPVSVETRRRRVSPRHRHWKPHSLGSIINQFKTACTKRIHAMGYGDFSWQRQFYDHIIRNDESLFHIRHYIRDNPQKWGCEKMIKTP